LELASIEVLLSCRSTTKSRGVAGFRRSRLAEIGYAHICAMFLYLCGKCGLPTFGTRGRLIFKDTESRLPQSRHGGGLDSSTSYNRRRRTTQLDKEIGTFPPDSIMRIEFSKRRGSNILLFRGDEV